MKRYIIQDNTTKKYLKRTKSGYSTRSSWMVSVDDATLITTASAASQIATQFCKGASYRRNRHATKSLPVRVIDVEILIYPAGVQPFMDGVLNGNK